MAFVTTYTGSYANGLSQSEANEQILWSTARAAAADAGIVEGSQWVDSSAASEVHKIYLDADGTGPTWKEVGSYQHGDLTFLDADGGQVVFFKFEQRASDRTPDANKIGAAWHRTDTEQLRVILDAATVGTIVTVPDGGYIAKELPLESWTLGGTAPAAATKGTTPAVPGLRFTTTAQTITRLVRVPAGFSGLDDVKVRVEMLLNLGESPNDDINLTLNYEVRAAGEAFGGTSSSVTGTTDIGADVADGTRKTVEFTLPFDDVNNPIVAGDLIAVELSLTNTTTIADVLFVGGEALFPHAAGFHE
jgi:hypothetical protein